MERLEREVLELPLHLLDTEAVGERRVDLERLGGHPLLLGRRERAHRAHVVQAIRELDQQDPDVARHRHDHLANVLRLGQLPCLELQAVELGEPVDDARHLLAEALLDLLDRLLGVLHGVVQERGLQGGGVEPEVG